MRSSWDLGSSAFWAHRNPAAFWKQISAALLIGRTFLSLIPPIRCARGTRKGAHICPGRLPGARDRHPSSLESNPFLGNATPIPSRPPSALPKFARGTICALSATLLTVTRNRIPNLHRARAPSHSHTINSPTNTCTAQTTMLDCESAWGGVKLACVNFTHANNSKCTKQPPKREKPRIQCDMEVKRISATELKEVLAEQRDQNLRAQGSACASEDRGQQLRMISRVEIEQKEFTSRGKTSFTIE